MRPIGSCTAVAAALLSAVLPGTQPANAQGDYFWNPAIGANYNDYSWNVVPRSVVETPLATNFLSTNGSGDYDYTNPVGTATTRLIFGSRPASGYRPYTAYDSNNTINQFVLNSLVFNSGYATQGFRISGQSLYFQPALNAVPSIEINYAHQTVISAPLLIASSLTIRSQQASAAANGMLTLSGPIHNGSVAGSLSLTIPNFTTVLTSAASTYSGDTWVHAGALRMGANNALSANSNLFVAAGATLDVHGYSATAPTLNTNPGGVVTNNGTSLGTLYLGKTSGYTSVLSGTTRDGTGRLSLVVNPSANPGAPNTLIMTRPGGATYSGDTVISSNSVLRAGSDADFHVGVANVFSPNSTHYLGQGAVLDTGGANQTIGGLGGGGAVLINNSTLTIGTNHQDTTFFGVLPTGSGQLIKDGNGMLVLAGERSAFYSGGTTVQGGTLRLAANDALMVGSDVTVNGGGLDVRATQHLNNIAVQSGGLNVQGTLYLSNLTLGDGVRTAVRGDVTGTGTIILSGNVLYRDVPNRPTLPSEIGANIELTPGVHSFTSASTATNSAYDLVVNGAISGSGGIYTQGGAGYAFGLVGNNTYTGGTTIGSGLLVTGATNTLPATGAVSVGSAGTLDLAPSFSSGGVLAGNHNQTIGSLTGRGKVNLGGATLTVGNGDGGSFFQGTIQGTGQLVKIGAGALDLYGVNTYTGGTTICQGIVRLGRDEALPTGGDVTIVRGGLDLNGTNPTIGNLTFGDGVSAAPMTISGGGNLTLQGNVLFKAHPGGVTPAPRIESDMTLTPGNHVFTSNGNFTGEAYDTLITGNIGGAGGIRKEGSSYWLALAGQNTYTGPTEVAGGIMMLLAENTLPGQGAVTVGAGASLLLHDPYLFGPPSTHGYNQRIGSLSGAGSVSLGTGRLTVGSNGANTTFSGNLAGTGGLTKTGSGTLTLSGANTYSGTTIVEGGILAVNNTSGSGTGTGAVTVYQGGMLTGTGSIAGDVILEGGSLAGSLLIDGDLYNGGLVSPGFSPGALTVSGNYKQAANGSLFIEIGGDKPDRFDTLKVLGSAVLDGELQIAFYGGSAPSDNTFFEIFSAANGISGKFSQVRLPEGYRMTVDGTRLTLIAGSVSAAAPEPSSVALFGALFPLAGAVIARRRLK
jgi:autotransporter-associated beta strand protein